jgi:hypothetical protein
MATNVRIVLPAGTTVGSVKHRKWRDASKDVDLMVPYGVDVEFITPSPSGTQGASIIDNDGNKFFLEQPQAKKRAKAKKSIKRSGRK